MLDYYEALDVDESADIADIKKAWRQAQVKFHPDRNPGNAAAEERFKACSEAYEVLSDPHRRRVYDATRFVGPEGAIDPSIFDEVDGEDAQEIISSFVKICSQTLDQNMPFFRKVAEHFDDYEERLERKQRRARSKQKSKDYRVVTQGGVTVRLPK